MVALSPSISHAACLAGDTSTDCIGVYKVPIDDKVLKYTETPEKLKAFAPDLRWVPPVKYPTTYGEAVADLKSARERCVALNDLVLKGNLELAGKELLDVTPRVTCAGRVVVGMLSGAPKRDAWSSGGDDLSMKGYRAEVALSELEVSLGQCDILIGQGLRGQLGASAPAQIQILELVKEINSYFDEVLQIVPETFKG